MGRIRAVDGAPPTRKRLNSPLNNALRHERSRLGFVAPPATLTCSLSLAPTRNPNAVRTTYEPRLGHASWLRWEMARALAACGRILCSSRACGGRHSCAHQDPGRSSHAHGDPQRCPFCTATRSSHPSMSIFPAAPHLCQACPLGFVAWHDRAKRRGRPHVVDRGCGRRRRLRAPATASPSGLSSAVTLSLPFFFLFLSTGW